MRDSADWCPQAAPIIAQTPIRRDAGMGAQGLPDWLRGLFGASLEMGGAAWTINEMAVVHRERHLAVPPAP